MKFSIEYTAKIEPKKLIYRIDEWSFDTEPSVQEINFDIVVNKLNLTVVDNDNKIVQLWGFCGLDEKMKSTYKVPEYKAGILRVVDDLEGGLAYRVNKDELPIYVNTRTGWVCVGDPDKKGNAVEFISNCVAVINSDNEFVSLWLKPDRLPDI